MYLKEENIKSQVDWLTITIYIILMICGWISIHGASYDYDNQISIFDISGRAGSQLIWMGTSLIIAFVLLKLDSNLFDVLAYYIYIAFMILLLVTIFVAPNIKGSHSWIVITDSIRLQPAEFAKFAVALALAKYLSTYNLRLMSAKSLFTIVCIIMLPIILILLQSETGSALVFLSLILVLYRVGLPGIVLILGAAAILLFVVGLKFSEIDLGIINEGEFVSIYIILILVASTIFSYRRDFVATRNIVIGTLLISAIAYFLEQAQVTINWGFIGVSTFVLVILYVLYLAKKHWNKTYLFIALFAISGMAFVSSIDYLFHEVLQPHQQMRIKVTLGMEEDLQGAGYNVNQSKIAIGSGGVMGKGFLNGTQTKLKYVPEQDTDFIFCTIGEEQGFIGSVTVLLLFLILILRLMYLAERQKNIFGLVYGYCVASILFFHLAINIGMVIGLTPVIGIPLPFFSYGGSSLWGFTILLFIFLRMDMSRKRR